jgi:hypothetical protein
MLKHIHLLIPEEIKPLLFLREKPQWSSNFGEPAEEQGSYLMVVPAVLLNRQLAFLEDRLIQLPWAEAVEAGIQDRQTVSQMLMEPPISERRVAEDQLQ